MTEQPTAIPTPDDKKRADDKKKSKKELEEELVRRTHRLVAIVTNPLAFYIVGRGSTIEKRARATG